MRLHRAEKERVEVRALCARAFRIPAEVRTAVLSATAERDGSRARKRRPDLE